MADPEEDDPRRHLFAAVKRLDRHRKEHAKLEALRDDQQREIDEWFDDASHGEVLEIARLENEIRAWAREHRTDDTKSWVTPWGRVTTTVTKGLITVTDEPLLRDWCEEHGYLNDPKPPSLDLKRLRAEAAAEDLDGGPLALRFEDELVPGVAIVGVGHINVGGMIPKEEPDDE